MDKARLRKVFVWRATLAILLVAVVLLWAALAVPLIFAALVAPPVAFIIAVCFVALPAVGIFAVWQKAFPPQDDQA